MAKYSIIGLPTWYVPGLASKEIKMSANGIAQLALKRARQDAKLALANTDRANRNIVQPGRYADTTADATQLPTRYNASSNTGTLVDNPNTGGLLQKRPWA